MTRRRTTVAVAAAVAALGLAALAPTAQAVPVVDTTSDDILCIAHRTIDAGACVDDSAVVLVRRLVQRPPQP